MRRFNVVFLFFTFSSVIFLPVSTQGKPTLDPQAIAQTKARQEGAEKTGYGSYEVDSLHRMIEDTLPFLKYKVEKDKNGNSRFILPISSGETIKGISERYIYKGVVYLYIGSGGKKLKKVIFDFVRINPIGSKFKEEKRQIINPTPFFNKDPSMIDRNDDMILTYFEKETVESVKNQADYDKLPFKKKSEYVLKNIPFFEKKIRVVSTYANYIRRTLRKIRKKVERAELAEKVKIEYMLQLQ